MTERKPPGVSFESFVDKQIREAEARGDFARLPGAGKPLDGLDKPYDELWWIRKKMHQEQLPGALPPALALRKEVEDALAAAPEAPSERAVRALLEPLNEKIAEFLRRPPAGPHLGRGPVDIDEVVREWRRARQEG
ncbi:DUF1992 domain-containing protein [Streptomyces indicus]|uniref:DnaJ homologue subfamily C member 28 conserved domain-containing protein n=1 Tax=Streptomyces indicus TaxID=417292 RepID=A0A1G8YER3_9ACTN|nr:DUF1992 domain-containing protein [Streptomyces indicus]SDK01362.1 protein of unknown function [Streptomyces indicus]